jgi:hypothetical protein
VVETGWRASYGLEATGVHLRFGWWLVLMLRWVRRANVLRDEIHLAA